MKIHYNIIGHPLYDESYGVYDVTHHTEIMAKSMTSHHLLQREL